MTRRLRAPAAGMAAVAVALGVSELLAGVVEGVPSLVTAVGSLLIPFVPPALERWAIEMFGTSDKAVLNAGTTVLTLAVGAYAGVRAGRRLGDGIRAIVALAALGLVAALFAPLRSPARTVLAVALAAVAGVGVLAALIRLHRRADPPARDGILGGTDAADTTDAADADPDRTRRAFLAATLTAVIAAGAVALAGRALTNARTARQAAARTLPDPVRALPPPGPQHAFEGIAGLPPIHVPNDRFYRIDTALTVPRVDPDSWTLRLTGMVDEEVELTYDELLALPLVERDVTLACVSNEVGGDLVGNARWLGVLLGDVLDLAGVRAGATQIVGRSIDGWTGGFPTEIGLDGRPSLVAVGMNGEPLPARHGFPARLVVPGLYGYVSATKWLTEIELTTLEAFDGYWIPRGWAKSGPVKMASRIDVPRGGDTVPAGGTVLAGVAWAPAHGVAEVQIQVDDGPWIPCELTEPLADSAWVQWKRDVDLDEGRYVVRVRMIDGRGRLQVERFSPPAPDGATGYHAVRVTVAPHVRG